MGEQPTPKQIAVYLREVERMRCNCDLDNWEPERQTGHSHVCRIHIAAMRPSDRPGLVELVQQNLGAGA
jgi:hypothetical protein